MRIKAGIIGTGFIGAAHLEAIRRLGFVEVVAIAENNQDLADKKAKEFNIPLAYGSIDDFLANPDIQVVHNCTPNHIHAEINKKIINAGKHVFSEKPLCLTPQEADELVSLAEQKGIVHGVGFVYRHFAMVQQARAMCKKDELGKVFAVHGHYLQDWLLFDTDYNWRIEPEIGGISRTVADIGSHWCDTVQFVTGKRIASVFADFSIVHPVRKVSKNQETFSVAKQDQAFEEKPVVTEDYANILLRFEDGTKGSFVVSQVSAGHKNDLKLNVDGSKKSLSWKQENPQYLKIGYREQANQIISDDPSLADKDIALSIHFPGGHIEGWPDAFKNMLLKYYSFIRDNKKIGVDHADFATFNEGARIVHIVDAIVRSSKEQRWVTI
ncbi:putative dehydrogenase [Cricetibacter osteomyelitidis]|uniref:Putative dehydrogenase n=1 Tax=Cricetibacter osteomyelitidis TaxID=1521931 RepID=A0A4R2TDA6_9PAST|nr:Gfo/Idh/MocA family oxidoreductase [Cricetibacter osteomyelitidis]TCP95108.1 putative dehydrogenase [Cricetibacter osteomyelitidis]